jgi:hypothetical protein
VFGWISSDRVSPWDIRRYILGLQVLPRDLAATRLLHQMLARISSPHGRRLQEPRPAAFRIQREAERFPFVSQAIVSISAGTLAWNDVRAPRLR